MINAHNEFSILLYRIYTGAKVTGHPAEDDYRQLYEDYINESPEVADRIADEIQLLKNQGEHDLARELIVALVHSSASTETAQLADAKG